jgi:hypothetical protein
MWSGLSFLAATEAGEVLRRHIRAAAIASFGILAGVAALAFGLIALHAWLLQRFTPVEASLMIAAGLVLVCVAFLMIAVFVRRSRKYPSALASTAIVAAPMAVRLIGGRLNFKAVGIASVLALGAIVGRQLGRSRSG